MSRFELRSRWRAVWQAWPPAGAVLVVLSFVATATWLVLGLRDVEGGPSGWLEPLAAILGGLGAFVLTAILIFRRVDGAREEAESYGLSRGLATGYYFNFVRPLLAAMSDPAHGLHERVKGFGGHSLVGLVVGIPQTLDEFNPARHEALLAALAESPSGGYTLQRLEVPVAGRARGLAVTVALGRRSQRAVLVDLPTTLAVVADFASFVAEGGTEAAADHELLNQAQKALVASSEAERFQNVLEEFVDVVNRVGARESRAMRPALRLHVVPAGRLTFRLDELVYG